MFLMNINLGIRGELYVIIKLEFFGNENEFQDSSAGVMFLSSMLLIVI